MADLDRSSDRPLLAFASQDGQAAKIAARIAASFEPAADRIDVATLGDEGEVRVACLGRPVVALVAAVRYGRHLAPAERFLDHYRRMEGAPPLALASVNLTARKPNKRTLETNPYLKKLVARHRLSPAATAVFAGRLDYPRYRWIDRQLIRFIMLVTGGPTDGVSTIDYTDWASVDAFAAELGELAARGRREEPSVEGVAHQ